MPSDNTKRKPSGATYRQRKKVKTAEDNKLSELMKQYLRPSPCAEQTQQPGDEEQRKRVKEELINDEISVSNLHAISSKYPGTASLVSGTLTSDPNDEQVQQHEDGDCQKEKAAELAEDAGSRNENELECHSCSRVDEVQRERVEEELNDGKISMSDLISPKDPSSLVSGTLASDSDDGQVQQHEDGEEKKAAELPEDAVSRNENELEYHSCSSVDEVQWERVEEESNNREISVSDLISPKDPASLVSGTFTSNEKALILNLGPCQPTKCVLETRKKRIGKHNRYCSQESFIRKDVSNGRRLWLSYSLSKDALFCLPCILFSDPALRGEHIRAAQGHAFTKEGFSNWKKQEEKISDHEKCITHRNSVVAQALFLQQKAVSDLMTKEAKLEIERRKMQVKKNRSVLEPIVRTIMHLSRQGLALRGHREKLNSDSNAGNFLETLKFVSHYNSSLKEHLEKVKEREEAMQAKVGSTGTGKRKRCGRGSVLNFLSNRTQNTLVSVISHQLSNMLKKKIEESLSWSLIADTTPDVSHHEQLSICVRIVNANGTVSEHLLFCKRAMGTTAQDLADLIFSALDSQNISLSKLVAQAYDGASVMSGLYNGLQVLLSARCGRDIPYVHCCGHVLNLVLSDLATVAIDVVTLFGNLETLYLLFTKSNPIHRIFEEVQNSKKFKVRSMKRLNTVRWQSRENCLNVLLERYDCVIQTLQQIVTGTSFNYKQRAEASGLLCSMQTKQFLATAYLFKRIFEVTGPLSRYLQAVDMDLSKAFAMVDTAISSLQEMRCNSTEIISSMEIAHGHCDPGPSDNSVSNSKAEESSGIQWRSTRSKDQPETIWTRNTFYVVLDAILASMRNRFEKNRKLFETLAVFSPSYFPMLTAKYRNGKGLTPIIQPFCEKFGLEAPSCADELLSFAKAYQKLQQHNIDIESYGDDESCEESEDGENDDEVTSTSTCTKTTTTSTVSVRQIGRRKSPLYSAFSLLCNESYRLVDAFPELCKIYSIAMAIPSTSCTAERSFSALKRVKTRLRSTMVQDRLEGLLLMSVERKLLSRIEIESVIDEYALTSKELSKALL